MSGNFRIDFEREEDDLLVNPVGDFDEKAAWEFIRFLFKNYDGRGNVFVDTENLRHVGIYGCGVLYCHLCLSGVPADRVFFKGENGYRIAPAGSNVVACFPKNRCRCKGHCQNCRCSREKFGTDTEPNQ